MMGFSVLLLFVCFKYRVSASGLLVYHGKPTYPLNVEVQLLDLGWETFFCQGQYKYVCHSWAIQNYRQKLAGYIWSSCSFARLC